MKNNFIGIIFLMLLIATWSFQKQIGDSLNGQGGNPYKTEK
jgi:hypothetical protein